MLDNKAWQAELRRVDHALRSCVIPAAPPPAGTLKPRITFYGSATSVTLTLNAHAASNNMQTDASAFEGWSLALLEHCGVRQVKVIAEPSASGGTPHRNRHAYRLKRFRELIDEVDGEEPVPGNAESEWTINKSGHRSATCEIGQPWKMMRRVENPRSEKAVEMGLEASLAFRRHFDLQQVMRQWPVGVRDVGDGKVLFPGGGGSQADLVGISGDTLCVFELKVGSNKKVGALSELFFYSCVLRDVLLGRFKYAAIGSAKNCQIAPADVLRCKRIKALIIKDGPHHPLLEESKLLDRMNREIAARWPEFPITFQLAYINRIPSADGEDFEFRP